MIEQGEITKVPLVKIHQAYQMTFQIKHFIKLVLSGSHKSIQSNRVFMIILFKNDIIFFLNHNKKNFVKGKCYKQRCYYFF